MKNVWMFSRVNTVIMKCFSKSRRLIATERLLPSLYITTWLEVKLSNQESVEIGNHLGSFEIDLQYSDRLEKKGNKEEGTRNNDCATQCPIR
jgi:hypothetical protein